MVEAAGIEPASPTKSTSYKDGQEESHPGLSISQVGQTQEVNSGARSKRRTEAVPSEPQAGPGESTTGAQRQTGGSPAGVEGQAHDPSQSEDLDTVVRAWGQLPRAMRYGILAMVRAATKEREHG